MKKKKIYYAHCIAIYGTEQEKEDIATLKALGFEVVNPSSDYYRNTVNKMICKGRTSTEIMNYFITVVAGCDGLAFRALDDETLSAGVAKEANAMRKSDRPVFELSDSSKRKVMSVGQTRKHIGRSR